MKRPLTALLFGLSLSSSAFAQLTAEQSVQLNKALSNMNGVNLQQGMAVATLLGCTEKQAGQQPTEALYAKLQAVGKQAQAYCKAQQPAQARALVIQAFRENRNDPVVIAANNCYTQNQTKLNVLAGPQASADMAKYIRLLHNPDTIEQEITEADICKTKPATPGI